MWALGASAVLLALFGWRVARSPGRASNGLLLIAGLFLLWLGAVLTLSSLGREDLAQVIGVGGLLLGPFTVALASLWLVVNGLIVMRREGIRPTNALPLLFGVGSLLVLSVVAAVWLDTGPPRPALWVLAGSVLLLLLYAYLGFHLLAYTVYALAYGRLPQLGEVRAVVVLGCGLSDGWQVTPLLAGRLKRGLQVWHEAGERGSAPVFVTSGGQGPDEKRAEAAAMAQWLIDRGVPQERIRIEDASTTTLENLRLSEAHLRDVDPGGVVVATSSYHVLRTASLARQLGLPWRVVGAPTASYYSPAAFLREFVAHLTYAWRWHAIAAALITAGILLLWVESALPR